MGWDRVFSLPIDPHARRVGRRALLPKVCVAAPLFAITAASSAGLLAARAVGRAHPLGWALGEELLINMMRVLLACGDIGVWRAFFRNVANPERLPPGLRAERAARPGGRSVWFSLSAPGAPQAALPGAPQAAALGAPQAAAAPAARAAVNIVFIHGGAFTAGSAWQYMLTYDKWLRELARRGVDAKVLSVEYPLAPEHRFPEGRDACEADIEWLLSPASGETAPVIVGGDSAGGNLALSALAHMRDTGRLPAPPRGLLLVSPCVDMSPGCVFARSDEEAAAAGAHDYLPKAKIGRALPHLYAQDLSDPYVSPTLLESLDGLAAREVLVMAGAAEVMVSDIRRFAKKLLASAPRSADPPIPAARHVPVPAGARVPAHGGGGLPASASTSSASSLAADGGPQDRPAGRGSGGPGGGSGWAAAYIEEPGRVHSWPMLMLAHLSARERPLYEFVERCLRL